MNGFWDILELGPTRDISAIKRAYAGKAKTCHPEEGPEGFLDLRKAYEAALDYAENGPARPLADQLGPYDKPKNSRENNRGELCTDSEENSREGEIPPAAPEEDGWYLRDEGPAAAANPYADGEAIRSFVDLYTGKQRKDPKRWMDYFTSDAFLDAGWDSRFTALLLEKVTEVEQDLPPCKEFLMWLCTAYQFSVKELMELDREQPERRKRRVELRTGAEFDGLEPILRIAAKGPLPKRPGGDELALLESFKDYRHLARLAESGVWNAKSMEEYLYILNRYIPVYIKERCDPKANPDNQRHQAGLRLILHFFRREDLPETLYREAWRKLDLKSAVMGRAKILYGPLRELVMEQVPGIAEEQAENFLQLNRAHDAYRARIIDEPEREDERSAAFFQREDLQKALRSPRFVAEQLLRFTNWRRDGMGLGLVRRMLEFYRENPDIPRAGEVVEALAEDLRVRVVAARNREDAQAEAFHWYERLTLQYRPLVRYWLNTAFFTARDPETGTLLSDYLDRNLPWQADWSRRFTEREDGSPPPRTMAMCMGEVEADLYPRHIEYRVDGRPVYRPCLPFERVVEESGDQFLFLLPLAYAPKSFYPSVYQEILLRISAVAVPEEDRDFVARCLANAVCRLPDEYRLISPEKVFPLTMYAETEEQLFGCFWWEGEGELELFEQTVFGPRPLKGREVEPGEAEAEACRLLAEAVSPTSFHLIIREAPWNIYYTELSGPEQEWPLPELWDPETNNYAMEETEEIARDPLYRQNKWEKLRQREAEDGLNILLPRFGKGELRRLELSWLEGKLVLVKDPAGYACFYFERGAGFDFWYSMLSKPEDYRTADLNNVTYVPFGMGKLEDYCVHKSPASILRNLERVFPEMGKSRIASGEASGWLWNCHVDRNNGQHKLFMAQQKLGGFPPDRGRNHLTKKGFVFSRYPIEIEKETLEGGTERTGIRSGSYGLASAALLEFMNGKLARLRLTWACKGPEPNQKHLVLLQDCGRFLMAWLEDDRKRAAFCAAEGSEENEATFLGHPVPEKLLHRDLKRIRNCVDLLLDDIDYTGPVAERYFLPAERPYGEILSLPLRDWIGAGG